MQGGEPKQAAEMGLASDAELVALARQGHAPAFRAIMQRHNRRLYRLARGILREDIEAEDVVQETYLSAFKGIAAFRGQASLSTWLTRIAMNEALGRLRRRRPMVELAALDSSLDRDDARIIAFPSIGAAQDDPERSAARREIRHFLERAIDALPEAFRVVFVMRVIEEMSIEETASHLGLRPATVKTRLHRARRLLRQAVDETLAAALMDTFPFAGARCDRITDAVLERLRLDVAES